MLPARILLVCGRTVIDQGETVADAKLRPAGGLLRGRQSVAQPVADNGIQLF